MIRSNEIQDPRGWASIIGQGDVEIALVASSLLFGLVCSILDADKEEVVNSTHGFIRESKL